MSLTFQSSLLLSPPLSIPQTQSFTKYVPVSSPHRRRHRPHMVTTNTNLPSSPSTPHQAPPPPLPKTTSTPFTNTTETQSQSIPTYDVIVIGGGPAGLSLSFNLGKRGIHTLCLDASLDKPWPNNYGTWLDEMETVGLDDCVERVWETAIAYVGRKKWGDEQKISRLDRKYARVDKTLLKSKFLQGCSNSGVVQVIQGVVQRIWDDDDGDGSGGNGEGLSTVLWNGCDENVGIGGKCRGRVVVDATGHRLMFVKFEQGKVPGFQAAYGIECEVVGKEGEMKEMVFMDYRDDHMQGSEQEKRVSQNVPTFLYVMPLGGKKVFFEETSLVASPPVPFHDLKERLYKRLKFNGVQVTRVMDEEFCLIPMGGEMPVLRQRVVAFGGAAALVHPATGYMIARALKLADNAAQIIADEVKNGVERSGDEISYRIWDRLWNIGRRRQRDFFNFGGEYISKIDLDTTRDFFSAFFRLPQKQWSDFLSFRLMKPLERLRFGLGVYARTSDRVRFSIILDGLKNGGIPLVRSLLPLYKVEDES